MCSIIIEDTLFYPRYLFLLGGNNKPIMCAQKQKLSLLSKYIVSLNKNNLHDNDAYLGKLTCTSILGLEYNIYNHLSKVTKSKEDIKPKIGKISYVYILIISRTITYLVMSLEK